MVCHDVPTNVEGVPPVARDVRSIPEEQLDAYREHLEGGLIAPSLTRAGERLRPAWMFRYLQKPHRVRRHLKMVMPDLQITPREALALTRYLATLKAPGAAPPAAPADPPPADLVAAGKSLYEKQPCATCHSDTPSGRYPAPRPEASVGRLQPAWIAAWIHKPGAMLPEGSLMPDTDLPDADLAALAAYVRSLAPAADAAGEAALADAEKAFPDATADEGRGLANVLNCAGCHALPDLKPRGQFAPKLVTGSQRFILESDIRAFLIAPVKVNHDDPGRMPVFSLPEADAAAIAAYLARLDPIDLGRGVAGGFRIDPLPIAGPELGSLTGVAVDAAGVPYLCRSERGEIYRFRDADGDGVEEVRETFADGLDLPLGLAFERDGALLVVQRGELTRLRDTDNDGRADSFQAVFDDWDIFLWHQWTHTLFSFGPAIGPDDVIYVTSPTSRYFPDQGLSTGGGLRGRVLAVRPDGRKEIFARGFKVPYGLAADEDGRVFVHDNDHGFGGGGHYDVIFHVRPGGYHRHGKPDWDPAPYPAGEEPVMHFLPPYGSTATGIAACPKSSGHPFGGQLFVTRYAGGMVCRIEFIPTADGHVNAVAYPFCAADQPCGIGFGRDGALWVGGGNGRAYKVRRAPGEDVQDLVSIRLPDAAHLRLVAARPFTEAERVVVTRTELYRLEKGHAEEGTPIGSVVRGPLAVKSARVLEDGRTVELEVEAMGPRSTQALHVAGWPGPFRQAVYLIEINGGW
jgi:mono/diheme cytochrome c family protein/glucose/arabinose dehydrogenase